MTSVRIVAIAILGFSFAGCAEPGSLGVPGAAGNRTSGTGGARMTTTPAATGGGLNPSTGGAASLPRGGTSSTTPVGAAGSTARAGAAATIAAGGSYTPPAPSCTDRLKNGEETDVDCGGACETKCAVGKACASDADCVVSICADKICTTCKNATKDGDESDVDCGGSCPRCLEGQSCSSVSDCATYNCDATAALCGPPTSCLAAVPADCACAKKVVNAGDAVGCQKVIDCYLVNSCGPADACAASNDAVCGSNTLGIDAGKAQAAKAVYDCACGK